MRGDITLEDLQRGTKSAHGAASQKAYKGPPALKKKRHVERFLLEK